jgi:hypothetical protein
LSGDELDEAIDHAVRGIMSAEPPSGLRQRVLLQLLEPERRVWFPMPGLGVVAAALLCVIVGGFVMLVVERNRTAAPDKVVSAQPSAPRIEPPAPARAPAQTAPTSIAARAERRPSRIESGPSTLRPNDRIVSATSLNDADSLVTIAPLDPLRRIDPAPVKSEVVQVDEIAIAPLQQMEPVSIEPLSSMPR